MKRGRIINPASSLFSLCFLFSFFVFGDLDFDRSRYERPFFPGKRKEF